MSEARACCRHLARFGMPVESAHLSTYRDSYDMLVFNANTVAHMPGAVARLVSDGTAKPFLIDPQTHAFQHDPSHIMRQDNTGSWSLKKSIEKLAEVYGSVIREKAGSRPVIPSDVTESVAQDLAAGVIEFQMSTVADQDVASENREYLEWAGLDITKPDLVVAPYFYMDDRTLGEWLDVNYRLAIAAMSYAAEHYPGTKVFLELVVDRDIFSNEEAVEELAEAYGSTDCAGVLLWVDGLVEHEAPERVLRGFARLAASLRDYGKEVYNLYGGYLSILLSHPDFGSLLTGVCHGMEYGESRSVVPVGGGIPMAKYYFPALHLRMRYGDAARLFFQRGFLDSPDAFFSAVCDCDTCREVLGDDPQENFAAFGDGKPVTFRRRGAVVTLSYPNQDTKGKCLSHYLHRKRTEFTSVRDKQSSELIQELRVAADEYEGDLGIEAVSHLRIWDRLLSSLT